MEMKKIFFAAIGLACLMASCTKDDTLTPSVNNDYVGQEVAFTSDFSTATRTLYAEEYTNSIAVKWVDGDLISVYGAACSNKQAEYKVTGATGTEDADNDPTTPGTTNFYYASSLDKTGDSGIQWGTTQSDFFAVYPAKGASFNEDGSINTSIAQTQHNVFAAADVDENGNALGWVGQPFDNDATDPTMTNAIMYAYTPAANTEVGGTVNLRFKPFSTVLKFRLAGINASIPTGTVVNVTKITIEAPTNIAGNFKIDPTTGTATATTNGKNTIEITPIISTGSYLPITNGQYIEFNVFTMPVSNQVIATSGNWTVKIETALHGTHTYKLKPTTDMKLTPGQIHKIAVPAITTLGNVTWDYSKWMTQIPPKVYLSELSVPGTWYTNDSDYQATTDVATLYNAGIRAFNIDCRTTKKPGTTEIWGFKITHEWADSDYETNSYLACAGTEKAFGIDIGGYQSLEYGTQVLDVVKQLCALAAKHTDEYIVIVFTFAEKPMDNSNVIFGSVRPDYITTQLNAILNTEGIEEYIYTGITKDTTIEDVLTPDANNVVRNVIVKINHSNVDFATSTSPSFDMPTGIMASFGSMAQSGYIQTGVTDIISGITDSSSKYYGYYSKMQSYPIYNGKTASGLMYHYHQAQNTTNNTTQGVTTYTATPTLGNRMDAIDDIIAESTKVYNASTHDAWFQIGIGGSIGGNNPAGMAPLVTYLKNQIDEKAITDPSPVGIVLMNHATTTGAELVKSIIDMNAKFYLKREGGDITTGGTDGSGSGSGSGTGTGSNEGSGSEDGDQGDDQQ